MSKPLNPSASEYKPLSLYQPQYVAVPLIYQHTSFIHFHPYNTPNFTPRLRKPKNYPMVSKLVWVEKQVSKKKTKSAAAFHVNGDDDSVSAEEAKKFNGKTSVMVRNIPKPFKRIDLQWLLDVHCKAENERGYETEGSTFCKSAYDFLYLPMDFGFDMNLGFAFVNFTNPVAAIRFYKACNNREWSCVSTRKKICEIGIAKFQGKHLKENFQHSIFPCGTDEYLPVVFSPPRDGFIHSTPSLIGRRTRTATPKEGRVRVMAKRKINKKAMN